MCCLAVLDTTYCIALLDGAPLARSNKILQNLLLGNIRTEILCGLTFGESTIFFVKWGFILLSHQPWHCSNDHGFTHSALTLKKKMLQWLLLFDAAVDEKCSLILWTNVCLWAARLAAVKKRLFRCTSAPKLVFGRGAFKPCTNECAFLCKKVQEPFYVFCVYCLSPSSSSSY